MSLNLFVNSGILASSGFSPEQLSSLILWLDASDQTTITQSANAVSQWSDKSGNNNNAVQPIEVGKPITNTNTINSLNVLYFDGNNDYFEVQNLNSYASQVFTFFIIARPITGSTFGKDIFVKYFSAGVPYITWGLEWYSDSKWSINTGSTTDGFLVTKSTNTFSQAPTLLLAEYTLTNKTLTINGNVEANQATTSTSKQYNTGPITIGTFLSDNSPNNAYQGDIGEIVFYDRQLSVVEKQLVSDYLSNKWGV